MLSAFFPSGRLALGRASCPPAQKLPPSTPRPVARTRRPQPMKRLTVPSIRQRKGGEAIVMVTPKRPHGAAARPHCDMCCVGDSLGQVYLRPAAYGRVTMEMMALHGAAVVRGRYHAEVSGRQPFGYGSEPRTGIHQRRAPAQGKPARRGEDGRWAQRARADDRISEPARHSVMGHVGLTPQAVISSAAMVCAARARKRHGRSSED